MFWASSGRQQLVMVSRCAVNAIVTGLRRAPDGHWPTEVIAGLPPICHTTCETWWAREADAARKSTCVSQWQNLEIASSRNFLMIFFQRLEAACFKRKARKARDTLRSLGPANVTFQPMLPATALREPWQTVLPPPLLRDPLFFPDTQPKIPFWFPPWNLYKPVLFACLPP